ncbi:unnamed protein product [Paramecium sonneborni]|uniref:Phospholipid scramblase n=1 Tax=Paramecium sonneborni TaxID=65129 RepID=A0A8S1QU84_9CILI|nr:unnamed protein product [Paramecium sonneborni]CAD8119149.1 unnamed protein product [Paramecium sonneborni]
MQNPLTKYLNTQDSMDQAQNYQLDEYKKRKDASCLDILGNQAGILIQQKFDNFQFRCLSPNVFQVFSINDQGQLMQQLAFFKCIEISSDCSKCCLGPKIRPFEMLAIQDAKTFYQTQIIQVKKILIERFLNLTEIIHALVAAQIYFIIGSYIYDSENNLKYMIEASTCQKYFWFRCPCSEECNQVDLEIKLPDGVVVAPIQKQLKNCCQKQNQDYYSDNLKVLFPQKASKEDKALILAATIFIEFSYFMRG